MRRVVVDAVHNTDFLLWARNQLRVAGVDLRDGKSIAQGIARYLAQRLTFVRDPLGIESITPPVKHAAALAKYRVIAGDCDDYATLGAALGKALGLRALFTVESFDWPAPATANPLYDKKNGWAFQHVYATLLPGTPRESWSVNLDLSRDPQQLPPKVKRSASVPV